jgi:nitrite reductase (NADH) small subunit
MASGEKVEHRVGSVGDFPVGSHQVVKVGRREIGIFNIRGTFYALPNLCPHQAGPLCRGERLSGTVAASANDRGTWDLDWVMDGEVIACPWHGLEFHVPTGRCLAFPKLTVRTYDVLVDGDAVRIRL